MKDKLIQSGAARWSLLISFIAVFALISGIYLPGCSENPTSSLETNLAQDETSFFDLPFDEAALAKGSTNPFGEVEVLYGEELFTVEDGGTMIIGSAGNRHEFVVQPGALVADTVIQVEITKIESNSDHISVLYEFKPDGLVFSTPATLRVNVFKVLGKGAPYVEFYYLNEVIGRWEFQGVYWADPVTGIAEVPLGHFSRWGMD